MKGFVRVRIEFVDVSFVIGLSSFRSDHVRFVRFTFGFTFVSLSFLCECFLLCSD